MALADISVLLDILNNHRVWANRSQATFEAAAKLEMMVINDIIYAELSTRFAAVEVEEVDAAISGLGLHDADPASGAAASWKSLCALSREKRHENRRAAGLFHRHARGD